MQSKKILGAAAFTVMMAGGAVTGALLGVPSLSGAVSTGSTTTTAPASGSTTPAVPTPGDRGPRGGGAGLDAAAKALGISTADLRTALQGGKTIAQVAKDKGVDVQQVIDAMVAAETKAIDQRAADAKASLPDRVKDQVNGVHPQGRPDGSGPMGGMGHGGPGMQLDTAAKAIGISADDLRTALQGGKTIAEVAKGKGVDPQQVIDALVAEANTRVDQAVKDGKLTSAEATTRKAEAKTRITSMVNEGFKGGPGGGMGGMGGMGGRPPRHR